MNSTLLPSFLRHAVAGVLLLGVAARDASADAITDWNAALEGTLTVPPAGPNERGPAVPVRTFAMLHAAMFDAVNGIVRTYEPLHVTDHAPPGAHAEAAAIQAAHVVLSSLRPGNQAVWDAQLAASLATLPGHPAWAQSIARGRAWGTTVANAIIAWRTGDIGPIVNPPSAGADPGYWLFTPENRGWAGRDFLVATPFLLPDPGVFDPGPPYGECTRANVLTNPTYLADVAEVAARGGAVSTERSAEDEFSALFLHAADLGSLNRLARSLVSPHARLVANARLFALLNATWFDTTIALFKAKYQHQFWRPYQAVGYANLAPGATFTWSLRPTPPHPEYPSAHVTLFTSTLQVVARLLGDCREVQLYAPGFADPVEYENMEAISDAAIDARVDIGYHFRETGEVSQVLGRAIGDHVVETALEPRRHHKHRWWFHRGAH